MNDPKVSVCMVTYNQERFIGQAVESALMQETTFPVEIVIGEDCSTDQTRSIVQELACRRPEKIRPLLAERNMGARANFMRTLGECRGQYVAMLEGDDYWTNPHKLQRQVDLLDARLDWAMCFHPAQIIYDDWRKEPGMWPEKWDKPEATIVDLFNMDFIPTNAVLFRNRLFKEFPAWFPKLVMGDWPLHILNAAHGNIGFLPEVMSVYRVHAGGLWTSTPRAEQLTAIMRMLTAVDHHFRGRYAEPIDQCRLNVLNYVINEANEAKQSAHEATTAPQELRDLRTIHDQFVEEHRALKSFHDEWAGSIPYKVVRETLRPFKDVRSWWIRRSAASRRPIAPTPPAATPPAAPPPKLPYPDVRAA